MYPSMHEVGLFPKRKLIVNY